MDAALTAGNALYRRANSQWSRGCAAAALVLAEYRRCLCLLRRATAADLVLGGAAFVAVAGPGALGRAQRSRRRRQRRLREFLRFVYDPPTAVRHDVAVDKSR